MGHSNMGRGNDSNGGNKNGSVDLDTLLKIGTFLIVFATFIIKYVA
ncbi:hypothetical protein MHZ92_05525 [Sporosarcina sp. ACRSL]|nr:hypothetical protein [Sporosarcina sp. ACRSL]MCG7343581.1 hypothetical protein [Sporosarcina sp. ACRSL]